MCSLLGACVAGIPATDTSAIATGIPQAEIEEVFGKPNEVRKTDFGTIALYKYDLGLQSAWEQMDREEQGLPVKEFVVLGVENLQKAEEQKAFMAIAYSANDISIAYESDRNIGAATRKAAAAVERQVRRGAVKQLGVDQLLALARCGDANAQDRIAWSYHNGFGLPRDPVEAYFWYSVAVRNAPRPGYLAFAGANLDVVEQAMEPEEIRAADHRVETWRPSPRRCDTAAANRPWR